MIKKAVYALIFASIALVLTSCGGNMQGKSSLPSIAHDPAIAAAEKAFNAGDYVTSANLYLEAAQKGKGEKITLYRLKAAESYFLDKNYRQAKKLLLQIEVFSAKLLAIKGILQAKLALSQFDSRSALQALNIPLESLDRSTQLQIQLLKAQAYHDMGEYLTAANIRIHIDDLIIDPTELQANRIAIWRTLSNFSALSLKGLPRVPAPDIMSGWIEFTYLSKTEFDTDSPFTERLSAWQLDYPRHPAKDTLSEILLSRFEQTKNYPNNIALLLPLSGKYSAIAQAIQNGFFAGLYSLKQNQNIKIRLYDIGSNAENITAQLTKAINEGADWIVGPVTKSAVNQLAYDHQQQKNIPVLSLNFTDKSIIAAENFYQLALAPEDEAIQAAERALLDKGYKGIMFTPQGDRGSRIAEAFRDRFESFGGIILSHKQFAPTSNDFSTLIKDALHLVDSQQRFNNLKNLLTADIKFDPRRREDIDFIFLAASPAQAHAIKPQLNFHHASKIPILAISDIYSGNLERKKDKDINGITFCDMPWILDADELQPNRRLVESLWPQSSKTYARLYALGLDAFQIIPYLNRLQQDQTETFSGSTGLLSMDADRRLHRTLLWAQIDKGKARLIH